MMYSSTVQSGPGGANEAAALGRRLNQSVMGNNYPGEVQGMLYEQMKRNYAQMPFAAKRAQYLASQPGYTTPTAPGGQPGPGNGNPSGGVPTVNTTIRPGSIFSNTDMQRQVNQNAARAFTNADSDFAMKQFVRPGASRDAGTLAAAAPAIGQGAAAARAALSFGPLADSLQNRQFQLEGEYERSKEGLGLADALRQLQQAKDYEYANQLQPILNSILGYL